MSGPDSAGKNPPPGDECIVPNAIFTPEPFTPEELEPYTLPRKRSPEETAVLDQWEFLLSASRKHVDQSPLMNILRNHTGSTYNLFRLDRYALQSLGMHRLDAYLYSMIPVFDRHMQRTSFGKHPPVGSLEAATPYIVATFLHLKAERFYLFCVNTRGTLKAKVMMNHGIEDRALLSLNQLMIEVLRYKPAGVIIAHNHPGGTLRPSQADIECTAQVMRTLSALNVPLLDHLIGVRRQVISIRENGFIPERVWMSQTPQNHLLRNWLVPLSERKKPKRKPPTPEKKREQMVRALRVRNNKRRRNMEMARSLYNKHSKQAQKDLKNYESLRRKVEYNDLESTRARKLAEIDKYIQRYARAYKRWQIMSERRKQMKKSRKKPKKKD